MANSQQAVQTGKVEENFGKISPEPRSHMLISGEFSGLLNYAFESEPKVFPSEKTNSRQVIQYLDFIWRRAPNANFYLPSCET